jgi:hypothetical protein
MKKICLTTAFVVSLLLTGCGHNVFTYTSGKDFNLGVDPNTGKLGVQYINADQITVVEKDNATLTVEMKDALDSDGKQTTRVSKIIYEIKEQTTGTDVDLKKAEK